MDDRALFINGSLVDIDGSTAIGITIQAYDIAEPGVPKTNVSNEFSIPLTTRNRLILGDPGAPTSEALVVYTSLVIDYWVAGELMIEQANGRVTQVVEDDRVSMYVFDKGAVWNSLKLQTFEALTIAYFDSLTVPKAGAMYLYPTDQPPNEAFGDFASDNFTNGPLFIRHKLSNLGIIPSGTSFAETPGNILFRGDGELADDNTRTIGFGMHISTKARALVEFALAQFGYTLGGLTDTIAAGLEVSIPNLTVETAEHPTVSDAWGFFFRQVQVGALVSAQMFELTPHTGRPAVLDLTAYDFCMAYFKYFNTMLRTNGAALDALRFDDIGTAPLVDFSQSVSDKPYIFEAYVENWAQVSSIKFASVGTGLPETSGARVFSTSNTTIAPTATVGTIQAHWPGVTPWGLTFSVLNFSSIGATQHFCFFLPTAALDSVTIRLRQLGIPVLRGILQSTAQLARAVAYDINSEFTVLAGAMVRPKVYSVEMWLTASEVWRIDFGKLYSLHQLGGSFFIVEIQGFNPSESIMPVTIKMLKITDKVIPPSAGNAFYWRYNDMRICHALVGRFY